MAEEYIKREAVVKTTDILDEYLNDYERLYFVKAIKNIPTADVFEVVRCKDCEHKKEIHDCQKELYSSSCVACSYHSGLIMDGNDFCSYGIKKEGAEE